MAYRRGGGWQAPFLDKSILLQNPGDEPTVARDEFGRPINPTPVDGWGVKVSANRLDLAPFTELVEGVAAIRAGRTVYTIRGRSGIVGESRVFDLERRVVYTLAGLPVRRQEGPSIEAYLELHCERSSTG